MASSASKMSVATESRIHCTYQRIVWRIGGLRHKKQFRIVAGGMFCRRGVVLRMVEQYRSARYEGILATSGLFNAKTHVLSLAVSGARLTDDKRVEGQPPQAAQPELLCTALPETERYLKIPQVHKAARWCYSSRVSQVAL